MLMLFARITYFDNQEFPLSKGITFGAAISFLFLSGFVLRREANELKYCVKKSVRTMRVKGVGNMCVNNAVQDEIIRRIDGIDEGAFQPMLEQPVMQALLIILAGKYKGRKPTLDAIRQEVVRLAGERMTKTAIAGQLNIGEATVYRILAAASKQRILSLEMG